MNQNNFGLIINFVKVILSMIIKNCPICNTREFSERIYEKKLPVDFNKVNFAGRKNPDGYHYEMLRCSRCSLLYASEIYNVEETNKLYQESTFDYVNEINGLTKSYSNVLKESLKILENNKDNFLEIVRPLLDLEKKDLTNISNEVFDFFVQDPSNKNKDFKRVRIRNLLQSLEKEGLDKKKLLLTINNLKDSDQSIKFYVNKNLKENMTFLKKKNI